MTEVLDDVVKRLESAGIEYMIGGSMASSLHGIGRQTVDIDIVVHVDKAGAEFVKNVLEPTYLVQGIESAFSGDDEHPMFQALHEKEFTRIDFMVLADDEFSRESFLRRARYEAFPGISAVFTTPEDIVLRKMLWYLMGRRMSDRQWNDLILVLEVQKDRLDWPYMNRWAAKLGLVDLLAEARTEAERLS